MKKVVYIAHRGLHNEIIPENSMEAFKEAIKSDFAIEFDVRMTKDKELVIFHDRSLKRLFNVDENIDELNYKDIVKLQLNNGENIPRLKDVLKLINGKVFIDLEIKNSRNWIKIVKLVNKEMKTYKGNYSIKSFNPLISLLYKKYNKDILCGVLSFKHTKYKCFGKILSRCNYIFYKPDFVSYNINDFDDVLNALFNKRNIPIQLWTIKTESELKKALKYANNIVFEKINLINK